jgi:predicted RNA-binding protein YlxR (DUF448 family)
MTRTCVGCHSAAEASELLRLVLGPDGTVVADPRGGAIGRGAWVHPAAECVSRAVPRGIAHTLKTNVKTSAEELMTQLRAAGTRRALSLVGAAFRARKAAAGATAAAEALERGLARLVVVAEDARAAAELPSVLAAVARGDGLVIGTKAQVGAALGRPETGVVAIMDEGIGASLRRAVALSALTLPRPARGAKKSDLVTETG